jgi:hypothetical protein
MDIAAWKLTRVPDSSRFLAEKRQKSDGMTTGWRPAHRATQHAMALTALPNMGPMQGMQSVATWVCRIHRWLIEWVNESICREKWWCFDVLHIMLILMPSLLPCTPYLLPYISYLCFPDVLADCFPYRSPTTSNFCSFIFLKMSSLFVSLFSPYFLQYGSSKYDHSQFFLRIVSYIVILYICLFPSFPPCFFPSVLFYFLHNLSSHSFACFSSPFGSQFFSLSFHPFATRGEIGNMAMATCTLGMERNRVALNW